MNQSRQAAVFISSREAVRRMTGYSAQEELLGARLPEATGAAVACPDRSVLCLSGDGSAMYTVQALWTQAREHLNVTTVIFNNRSYADPARGTQKYRGYTRAHNAQYL